MSASPTSMQTQFNTPDEEILTEVLTSAAILTQEQASIGTPSVQAACSSSSIPSSPDTTDSSFGPHAAATIVLNDNCLVTAVQTESISAFERYAQATATHENPRIRQTYGSRLETALEKALAIRNPTMVNRVLDKIATQVSNYPDTLQIYISKTQTTPQPPACQNPKVLNTAIAYKATNVITAAFHYELSQPYTPKFANPSAMSMEPSTFTQEQCLAARHVYETQRTHCPAEDRSTKIVNKNASLKKLVDNYTKMLQQIQRPTPRTYGASPASSSTPSAFGASPVNHSFFSRIATFFTWDNPSSGPSASR